MTKELPKLKPVPILITSYNRVEYLKKTIERINATTLYPYYIFVVDNNSTDGSIDYLKTAKVRGKIFEFITMPENLGQSRALNELLKRVEYWQGRRRPMADWVVFSNEDILPPLLRPDCWLERMIDIFERNEEADGLGALAMRIQRMSRAEIDESKEIIYWNKGIPSVFRLMRLSDMSKLGDEPMGRLLKWNSNSVATRLQTQLKKRYGFATHIYADHIGFAENKGYDKDTDTFTVAENKVNEHKDKPYPDIDKDTNVPIKINHPCDTQEQKLREDADKSPEATIIVLTCHRLDGLERIISSIKAKTSQVDYDLLVIADKDDTEAYNYCIKNNIGCILSSFHRDFVAQANLGIYAAQTNLFVVLGDDSEIKEETWLRRAIDIFRDRFVNTIGLMAFNDGIQKGRLFTMGMSSKKFVEDIGGHLYYPGYKHYGGDREVSRMAKELGLYHYAEEIEVDHHHYAKTGEEKDETYKESEQLYWRHDQLLKRKRQEKGGDYDNFRNHYDYS